MPKPMYWLKPYWMHQIYCDGIEYHARKEGADTRYAGCLVNGPGGLEMIGELCVSSHPCMLFYWCPMLARDYEEKSDIPVLKSVGYRLYAKVHKDDVEFEPIVEVRMNNDGNYRLYCSKEFSPGDAIIFLSDYEMASKCCMFLGGKHARTANQLADCNSYLTEGHVVRCTKALEIGDEIILFDSEECYDSFESIDRVVVSPQRMVVGRVTSDKSEHGVVVEYTDGTQDVVTRESAIGYTYRELN